MALAGATLFIKALEDEGIAVSEESKRSKESDIFASLNDLSDDDLYELALEERMQERGLCE